MTHIFSLNEKLSLSIKPTNSSQTEIKCPEASTEIAIVTPTRSLTGSQTGNQKSDYFRTRLKSIEKRNRAKYSKKIKDCENSKANLYQEKFYLRLMLAFDWPANEETILKASFKGILKKLLTEIYLPHEPV